MFWVLLLPHTKLEKEVTISHAPQSQRPWSFIEGEGGRKIQNFKVREEMLELPGDLWVESAELEMGYSKSGLKSESSFRNDWPLQEAASELIPRDWAQAIQKEEQRTVWVKVMFTTISWITLCSVHGTDAGSQVRSSARGKGHEEGGSTYAKAGSSLRSPPGNSRASTPKTRVCLLYYFVLSPTPLTLRGAVPHHLSLKKS